VGFSTVGGDVFSVLQIGRQMFFGQFVFDAASATCVIHKSQVFHTPPAFDANIDFNSFEYDANKGLTLSKQV